ncbi:MAG: FadR family transcriptional regulator [Rhodococcus sp.]|nr:FadR family transcriptional regulator [Rhodococcus sp. (in: high G+C Gram-positive bacteria)]
MEAVPITRATVSDGVFAQLADGILAGRVQPGDQLSSERDLAESFRVNRHAVREALKRLQQSGLVRVAHGSKPTVLDWRTHAGVDTLSMVAHSGALPALRLMRDIMVLRRTVAADAARLCALEADESQVAEILAEAERYSEPGDSAIAEVDLAFWRAVFAGSGNVAYQLAQNTLVAGYADVGWDTLAEVGVHAAEYDDPQAHVELAGRIAAGDSNGAYELADELLGRAVTAVTAAEREGNR